MASMLAEIFGVLFLVSLCGAAISFLGYLVSADARQYTYAKVFIMAACWGYGPPTTVFCIIAVVQMLAGK